MKKLIIISLLAVFGLAMCNQPEPHPQKAAVQVSDTTTDTTATDTTNTGTFLGFADSTINSVKGI